jgi:hypothetical protein
LHSSDAPPTGLGYIEDFRIGCHWSLTSAVIFQFLNDLSHRQLNQPSPRPSSWEEGDPFLPIERPLVPRGHSKRGISELDPSMCDLIETHTTLSSRHRVTGDGYEEREAAPGPETWPSNKGCSSFVAAIPGHPFVKEPELGTNTKEQGQRASSL